MTIQDLDYIIEFGGRGGDGEGIRYDNGDMKKNIPIAEDICDKITRETTPQEVEFCKKLRYNLGKMEDTMINHCHSFFPCYYKNADYVVLSGCRLVYFREMYYLISSCRHYTDYVGSANHNVVIAASKTPIFTKVKTRGDLRNYSRGEIRF